MAEKSNRIMKTAENIFEEPSVEENERLALIRLIRSENIGLKTFYSLLELYKTPTKSLEKAEEMAARGKKKIRICSASDVYEELENCEKYGAKIITKLDDEYPDQLAQITDAPPLLTILGNPQILAKQSIAIVGARNATANGCRFAYKIAESLGQKNYVVTSGLARGIDTAAHKGSVSTGTTAILAGGVDYIYPPENKKLYQNIVNNDGAIVAELPFGAAPKAQHFPQRNRIISGLSLGTVVVEAATRSGSLITARYALEHGREVFAVPGSPLDSRAEGPNKLIKEGAVLIESAEDIIHNLENPSAPRLNEGMFEDNIEDFPIEDLPEPSENDLDSARSEIKSLLGPTPVAIDELISQSGLPANLVQISLLELELDGLLTRHPGNKASILS